ncbi:multiple epidermal growth factor-like domains protein 10 [Crassostrea angulata]|uniref:multiple epidermal growth factor-like domains protein 10 n=1 Tax=Magallana angulata TaxID=2784310 RepID=UPI0022B205C9|nr:multiple epidermal growth factor-like domains protein 10 [Crassostrea angulata]
MEICHRVFFVVGAFIFTTVMTEVELYSNQKCATGFYGPKCELPCRHPNYGELCHLKCECIKQYCNHITGCQD